MKPVLSVVIAVQGGADRLPEVLQALAPQLDDRVEVLVCYAAEHAEIASLCEGVPHVKALAGTDGALIPHLWQQGILAATGERVAITVVHIRPASDWIARLLAADLHAFAGIGGSIDNAVDANGLSWAIYLLRYTRFGSKAPLRETSDIPGDNAVYDREAIMRHRAAFTDGFWEPEVHALLEREGRKLMFDPSLGTQHENGYDALGFIRQRFAHGARFGWDRGRGMPLPKRLAYLAATPAVPLVFGAKVLRQAWRDPLGRQHLLHALPYLWLFVHAWAAGEARGAARATLRPGG